MNNIIEFIKKDKVERCLKTFFEAFFSYLAISIATTDLTSTEAIKGLIIGALASAISIAINSFNKGDEE